MEIVYIIIGSFLTFVFTWVIEGIKNKKVRMENEETIRALLKQELFSISKDFEKLKNVLEYKNYFEIKVINFLDEKVIQLSQYKKDLTNLPKLKDREIIIELISDIKSFLSDIRILETMFLDDIKRDESDPEKIGIQFFNQKRLEKLVMLVEIQRRIENAYKKFE